MSNYTKYKNLGGKESNENFKKDTLDSVIDIQDIQHKQQLVTQNAVVVIDVYGDFCQPCKSMASRYAKLAEKYSRPGLCCIAKEDVDKHISQNITGVPAIQFFKNGKYITPDIVGADLVGIEKRIIELLQS